MDLSALNKVAERDFLSTKKAKDLEKDKENMVTALKEVKTRFGVTVVAEIAEEYQIFLSEKISSVLLKDTKLYEDMCNAANKLTLFIMYQGGNSFKFNTCTK